MSNVGFATTTSVVHNAGVNDTRLNDLMKEVRQFGRDSGEGGDALPKLAIAVVRAANDGVITTDKDKDGKDDAARIVETYSSEAGKKAIHERTKNGLKALNSKVRQLVIMGQMTTCDPVAVLDKAVEIRRGLLDNEAAKPKAAFAAYVDVARAQQALDRDMSDDEITVAITKPEAPDKDVIDYLKAIEKKLDRLITGEAGITDTSDDTLAARDAIKRRLAHMVNARDVAETMEKAEALGLHVVGLDLGKEVTSEVTEGDSGLDVSENPDRAELARIFATADAIAAEREQEAA